MWTNWKAKTLKIRLTLLMVCVFYKLMLGRCVKMICISLYAILVIEKRLQKMFGTATHLSQVRLQSGRQEPDAHGRHDNTSGR